MIIASIPDSVPRRKYFYGMGITFGLACLYPSTILINLRSDGYRWIQNDPAYSFFVLFMLPLAVGIYLGTFKYKYFKDLDKAKRTALTVLLLVMNLFAVIFGWNETFRGPVLTPAMLKESEKAVIVDRCLRKCIHAIRGQNAILCRNNDCLEITGSLQSVPLKDASIKAAHLYTQIMGETASFKSVRDFFARASTTAFVSSFFNILSGVFVMWVLWYVVLLVIFHRGSPLNTHDDLVVIYSLLLLWFPSRIYSEWYSNFYSIAHFRNYYAFWFLLTVAIMAIPLLVLLLKPGRPVAVFTTLNAIFIALIGIVNHFKPDWLNAIAQGIESMPFFYFSAFLLLIAVVFGVMVFAMLPLSQTWTE